MPSPWIPTAALTWQLHPLTQGGHLVLDGVADYHAAPELRQALLNAVQQYTSLLVDLERVVAMDSAAMACLVEACQVTRQLQGRFGLLGVGAGLQRLLHLARLDHVFTQYPSLAAWELTKKAPGPK